MTSTTSLISSDNNKSISNEIPENKKKIRNEVWTALEKNRATALMDYPPNCFGRIPHFKGNQFAANKLKDTLEWCKSKVIKVNASLAQQPVRYQVLKDRKELIVPEPMTEEKMNSEKDNSCEDFDSKFVFYHLKPWEIPRGKRKNAVTKAGIKKWGHRVVFGKVENAHVEDNASNAAKDNTSASEAQDNASNAVKDNASTSEAQDNASNAAKDNASKSEAQDNASNAAKDNASTSEAQDTASNAGKDNTSASVGPNATSNAGKDNTSASVGPDATSNAAKENAFMTKIPPAVHKNAAKMNKKCDPPDAAILIDGLSWANPAPLIQNLLPFIDIVVTGTVVVSRNGVRLGKGMGYAEREWDIFKRNDIVSPERTYIATTCHSLQCKDFLNHADYMNPSHDLPVDIIALDTGEVIKTPTTNRGQVYNDRRETRRVYCQKYFEADIQVENAQKDANNYKEANTASNIDGSPKKLPNEPFYRRYNGNPNEWRGNRKNWSLSSGNGWNTISNAWNTTSNGWNTTSNGWNTDSNGWNTDSNGWNTTSNGWTNWNKSSNNWSSGWINWNTK